MDIHHPITCHRRQAAGLTLVEIMVVVLIMVIAAGMALPMFAQTDTTRLVAAADLLAADLEYAKVESITHSEDPRLVVFDTVADAYHIAAASAPATPITNPVGNQPYLTTFGQGRAAECTGVTIDSYTLDGDDRVQFGLYGQLDQTTDATITLENSGNTITLTIDAVTGEVAIGNIN